MIALASYWTTVISHGFAIRGLHIKLFFAVMARATGIPFSPPPRAPPPQFPDNRFDRTLPVEAGNAAFTAMFLRRGLPLVFSGNEIADNSLNTFFAPVGDVGRASKTVDWARALQPAGQKRLAHVRRLAELRHADRIFAVVAWQGDLWRRSRG